MNDTAQMNYSALGGTLNGLTDSMSHHDCVALDVGITDNGQDAGILRISYGLTEGQSFLVSNTLIFWLSR